MVLNFFVLKKNSFTRIPFIFFLPSLKDLFADVLRPDINGRILELWWPDINYNDVSQIVIRVQAKAWTEYWRRGWVLVEVFLATVKQVICAVTSFGGVEDLPFKS